jgi:hypothetical protein
VTATAILDLEKSGFTREQVEALARWHEAGLDLSHLATKADLADVRTELAELRGDLKGEIAAAKFDTIKWVIGVGIVQIGSLIGVAYAILRLFPGGHP